jgi:hypothetical protein
MDATIDMAMWDKLRNLEHQAWALDASITDEMRCAEHGEKVELVIIEANINKLIDMFAIMSGVLK